MPRRPPSPIFVPGSSILLVSGRDGELWLVPIWSPQPADFRFDCAVAGKKRKSKLKNSAAKCATVAQLEFPGKSFCSPTLIQCKEKFEKLISLLVNCVVRENKDVSQFNGFGNRRSINRRVSCSVWRKRGSTDYSYLFHCSTLSFRVKK